MDIRLTNSFRQWNAGLLLVALCAGWIALLTLVWTAYGWVLFYVVPLYFGMLSALVRGFFEPYSSGIAVKFTLKLAGILAALLLLVAIEGILCIVMAIPLVLPLMMLGAGIGFLMQQAGAQRLGLLIVFTTAPILTGAAAIVDITSSTFEVSSNVVVDAPAHLVWEQVVTFPKLPPPSELLFKTGIAYPIGARIEGKGVGAIRYCEFNTGDFVEPITAWEEPHLLQFGVTDTPPAMEEWGIWGTVAAPHAEGFFQAKAGEFRIEPRGQGKVVLHGTTHYAHGLWPEGYWRMWSDYVIHRIHMRVLEQIKARAEAVAHAGLL